MERSNNKNNIPVRGGPFRGAENRGGPFRGGENRGGPLKRNASRGGYSKGNQSRNKSQNERPNNKVVKKYQEKAHIEALIISNKGRALQRLMRDYKEVKNCTIQYAGVTAHPLDNDFFEWHANIKALSSNLFKGAVMHLKFSFTTTYPSDAPKIFVLNDEVTHPSILPDKSICLDILEKKKDLYKGWNSGYTVLSILIQLQNFFFDIEESFYEENKIKKEISSQVRAMNEFNCSGCKHKGSSNPWPEFVKNDTDPTLHTMSKNTYLENIKKELTCYHTKIPFDETALGLGINIVKTPRTGEIRGIIPCLDLISLKAYSKERLRVSMSGQKFTHWFPLYLGINSEQFIHLAKKAISMIITGSTKNFNPNLIIKVLPKFFNIIIDIISEKVYSSCNSLKILIYIYRAAIEILIHFPSVRDEIDSILYKFLNEPLSRIKDNTPSLGDLLALIPLSSSYKIDEFLPFYISEQMDRQIFWIISSLPEFESLIESSSIDNIRSTICFKAGIVGNQILLFYYYLNKNIFFKHDTSLEEIAKKLDSNYGNLSNEEIFNHQKEIQKILKIDSYQNYYKYMNLPSIEDKDLNELLKKAYKNSAEKGYHGKDEVRFVPDEKKQIEIYMSKIPSIETFIKSGKLLDSDDGIWKQLCLEKFDVLERLKYKYAGQLITPELVIKFYEETKYEYQFQNKMGKFKPDCFIKREMSNEYTYKDESSIFDEKMNWRQVYLKIYLELYLKYFRYLADFQYLYTLLDVVKEDIIYLNLFVYDCENLKSDYNYIRIVLSKLKNLSNLSIIFNEGYNLKFIKNLIKGIGNFVQSGGILNELKINCLSNKIYSDKDFNILSVIDKLPTLKVLDLSFTPLDYNTSLRIRNHLYYFKSIETLNLSNCKLDDTMAKEIADGIMKAKSLEKIYLNDNNFKNGLANIIYNLAFQPSLKVLNISNNTNVDINETSTALYKLIKMSQSLKLLICKKIPGLNKKLSTEFYSSLGDNSSLNYLDLSYSGTFDEKNSVLLGNSIAFNSLKKGSLEILLLKDFGNYTGLCSLINGLEINEHLHFNWYGSQYNTNIVKDSKEYYLKTIHCSLKYLNIDSSEMKVNVNINDIKVSNINHLRMLFEASPTLNRISFASCFINKYFIDMLANALLYKNNIKSLNLNDNSNKDHRDLIKSLMIAFGTEEKPNINMKLQSLDLSKNLFGYSGIEAISAMLKHNKTLKLLNLFGNLFDVNGARRLRDSFMVNTTLEYIDIGYNRIKARGFGYIVEGLIANKSNQIKYIGSRYNFLKREGLLSNLPKLLKDSNVKHLDLSSNEYDNKTLYDAYSLLSREIKIDIFEKLYYISEERTERTVWMSPINSGETKYEIYKTLKELELNTKINDNSNLGIPLFISFKRGKNSNKKNKNNVDAFIEFIHPNSSNRIIKIASTNGITIKSQRVRVFKAGTKPEILLVKNKK